jgi:hypothetical protein
VSIIEKLKMGKSNVKVVDWPGLDGETIGITVLTEAETQEAQFAAERLFKDESIEVNAMTVGAYTSEANTQILFRALVNPQKKTKDGDYERIFSSVDQFRGLVRREAKEVLIDAYNAFEEECSPSPKKMSDEDLQALLDDAKKNSGMPGNDLSFSTLRQLITFTVNLLLSLQRDSGSTSSLPKAQ